MKKTLKKKMKSSVLAVRYFSEELIQFTKTEVFDDGSTGTCTWSCS